jgi:hypothetical protein
MSVNQNNLLLRRPNGVRDEVAGRRGSIGFNGDNLPLDLYRVDLNPNPRLGLSSQIPQLKMATSFGIKMATSFGITNM